MNICHVAYTNFESDNRVQRYVRAASDVGYNVDVVALRNEGTEPTAVRDHVRFLRVQAREAQEPGRLGHLARLLMFSARATVALAKINAQRPIDLVHVHNIPDFLVFSAIAPKLRGAKVILDIHDLVPELYAGKFGGGSVVTSALRAVERLSCRFADHVIVSNDLWLETVRSRSAALSRSSSILNYPDLDIFKTDSTAPGPSGTGPTFLYPGTLNHHQGLDLAVRAMPNVHESVPDARLIIHGRGPALPMLRSLVASLSLEQSVEFRPFLPLTEVPSVMRAASVGLVPKRADGFGNEAFSTKILEFMACGVPVIAPRTRIDSYYFTDSSVRFFEPGSTPDLAAAMVASILDPESTRRRAETGLELARSMSWQARRHEYLQLLNRLNSHMTEEGSIAP